MWTWRIVVTIKDEKGKRASFKAYLLAEKYSFEQAQAWTAALLQLLDQVIAGVITEARIERELTYPGLEPVPEGGADVEVRMQNAFELRFFDTVNGKTLYAGKKRLYRQAIPTWSEELTFIGAQTRTRYRASWMPEVLAFENLYHAAETLGHPAKPSDSRGIRIVSFHKSGKGLIYGKSHKR